MDTLLVLGCTIDKINPTYPNQIFFKDFLNNFGFLNIKLNYTNSITYLEN